MENQPAGQEGRRPNTTPSSAVAQRMNGYAHQHLPVYYANEYGIPTVNNTIGSYQEEFKQDSPSAIDHCTFRINRKFKQITHWFTRNAPDKVQAALVTR